MPLPLPVSLLLAATVALAGCGDDDDGDAAPDAAEDGEQATDAGVAESEDDFPAECPGATPFEIDVRTDGDGDVEPFTVVDAAAIRRFGGIAYTLYLTDFDLPDELSQFSAPEVPDGGLLISTGLDRFNVDPGTVDPLAVGATGPLFPDTGPAQESGFLSFIGDAAGSVSSNQAGSVELLGLAEDRICLRIAISGDTGGALAGVVEAPIELDI